MSNLNQFSKDYRSAKADRSVKKPKDTIYDPMGQWKYPGQVTKIPSGDITMQGVPYPVYGVDNLGNSQMMLPNMDYTFPGQSVTEYPMAMYGGDPSLPNITGHYPFGGQYTKTHTHMQVGGGKKNRTKIFIESPELLQDRGAGYKNPFNQEAQDFKKYITSTNPNEDVEIIPYYYNSNQPNQLEQYLQNSDANTRLAFFAHHGQNLFGRPASELGKVLQQTQYKNCYAGSCTFEDIATLPEYSSLHDFYYRPGYQWFGVNPNPNPFKGEEGIKYAMFSTIEDQSKYNDYNKQVENERAKFYKKWQGKDIVPGTTTDDYIGDYTPEYIEDLKKLNSRISNIAANQHIFATKIGTPTFGVDYNILNPSSSPQKDLSSVKKYGGWLNKYDKGGPRKPKVYTVPIAQVGGPYIERNYNSNSWYDPQADTIYLSKERGDDDLIHEMYHRQQTQEGRLRLPEYDPMGILRKKPSIPEVEGDYPYFNRRMVDQDILTEEFLNQNPSFQFVNPEAVYNLYTNPTMYNTPWTAEGEARASETHGGRKFLNEIDIAPNYLGEGFKKGGWLDKYQTGKQVKTLPKFTYPGAPTAAASTTSTDASNIAASKNFVFKRDQDLTKLGDTEFEEKYGTNKHTVKMNTNPSYRADVMKGAKETAKKYGSIDYPVEDVRSQNYVGNPNLAFMNPNGATGELARGIEDYNLGVIGAALPIPGIDKMGKIPSLYSAAADNSIIKGLGNKIKSITDPKIRHYIKEYNTSILPENFNRIPSIPRHTTSTVIEDLYKGEDLINEGVDKKIKQIISPEGKRRLINQEKAYLESIGFDPTKIDAQARQNYLARYNELKNLTNKNKSIANDINLIIKRKDISNAEKEKLAHQLLSKEVSLYNANATVTAAPDLLVLKNPVSGAINLTKPPLPVGGLSGPAQVHLGYGYGASRPTIFHEINHVLQKGRKLKIDDELRKLMPKKNLSPADANNRLYFYHGSKGKEPSSFLAEARQAMLEEGIINDEYELITPETVKKAFEHFSKNPKLTYTPYAKKKYISATRIFDFTDPTNPENIKILTNSLNELPAILPFVGAAGTGAYLYNQQPQKKYGGWLDKYQGGGEEGGRPNKLDFLNKFVSQHRSEPEPAAAPTPAPTPVQKTVPVVNTKVQSPTPVVKKVSPKPVKVIRKAPVKKAIQNTTPQTKTNAPVAVTKKIEKVPQQQTTFKQQITPAKKVVPVVKNPNTFKDKLNELGTVTSAITTLFPHVANDIISKEINNAKKIVSESVENTIKSAEDFLEYATNGIIRKTKIYTGINDDVELKKSDKPASVSDYYKNNSEVGTVDAVLDAPGAPGRQFKQQSLSVPNINWGVRNRGELKDIQSDGLEITLLHPFTKNKHRDDQTVITFDQSTGAVNAGKYKDFKNNKNILVSPTTMNYVTGFTKDKAGNYLYKDAPKNKGYFQPMIDVTNDPQGRSQGSLNLLVQNKNKDKFYGSVQGGRIFVKNPQTGEIQLISGSVDHIRKEFERIKGNNKYLEVYNLDNGTYARGLSYKDKKLTKERLNSYDNENGSGGNGLYIINYKTPPKKYREEYIQTPNVRTESDSSYIKGHPIKNEIKNIVLHHTAYVDPAKNEQQVKAQYMRPRRRTGYPGKGTQASAATSHVVIQENGKRVVYASPEQVTFHAGYSKWKGRDNVNDFSIGVEFQGDTDNKPLTNAQIESFVEYITPIVKKYKIPLKEIITHEMIRNEFLKGYTGKKHVDTKPDVSQKEYNRIINYMKSKGFK